MMNHTTVLTIPCLCANDFSIEKKGITCKFSKIVCVLFGKVNILLHKVTLVTNSNNVYQDR